MSGDDSREAILSRRARFVAAALASAGLVVGTADCGGQSTSDELPVTGGTGGASGGGGGANPCLGMPAGGGSYPCLAGAGGGGAYPCLSGAGGMLEDAEVPDAADADVTDAADADGSD